MPEWLWNIIIAVITGLTTTLSAALLFCIFNLGRNKWLGIKIKKIISKQCHLCGLMDHAFKLKYSGIVIKNPSVISLTIRAVWAEAGDENNNGRHPMAYIGPFAQEDVMLHSIASDYSENKEMYEFVILSPFTNGQWILKEEKLIHFQFAAFNRLLVYVEFQTFFKNPKIISVVITKPEILDNLNKMLAEVRKKNEAVVKNGR